MIKNQNAMTVITLIIIVVLVIIGIVLTINFINSNSIEHIKLTKDNLEETLREYSKQKKDTNDIAYVGYAVMHYTFNSLSNIYSQQDPYENLYGKTIKKLKSEGKSLMKENNVTVETFKKNMQLNLD